MRRALTVALISILIVACRQAPTGGQGWRFVSYELAEPGQYSPEDSLTNELSVVEDAATWTERWTRSGSETPPSVDWSREIVAAVRVARSRDCHPQVQGVDIDQGQRVVTIDVAQLAADGTEACSLMPGEPATLSVALDRSQLPQYPFAVVATNDYSCDGVCARIEVDLSD